jgi:hypothetical protein
MKPFDINENLTQLEKDHLVIEHIERGNKVIDLDPELVTLRVLRTLASDPSGFRLIPEKYLTDELLQTGMGYIQGREADLHRTVDYKLNYRLLAIKKIQQGSFTLAAINYDLIDKRMILQALKSSAMGGNGVISKIRPSLIDDEIALASLDTGYKFFFSVAPNYSFSLSTWTSAILKDEAYWAFAAKDECLPILKELLKAGYWPVKTLGPRPESIKSAIIDYRKEGFDSFMDVIYMNYIKSFPMEETLPWLEAKSRMALRESLYSIEELKPHMRQFPYLKGLVLESSLGL